MVSHWSLSDSKSPQVSRLRLRVLAVLSNAVVWIVSTRPPTSKSSRPFNNPLVIVSKAPITISSIVTFMFHSFFNSLARSRYLSFFSLSFRFILWSAGTAKLTIFQILFFLSFFFFVPYYEVWSSGRDYYCYYYYYFTHLEFFYYYYFTHLEFFTSALADGISLEFEWQQVSSSLQDSSQYSGRAYRLDGLHSAANFQVPPDP